MCHEPRDPSNPRATSDAVTTGATVTRLEDCANSGAVCHVIT